ncbi:MAG TPA: NAD(P)/FAD-dependent oxidoreductase [Candidatus Limnocylindrales bacterium]|nr:NAD(P)/FAD-dependent oxidoreductase [Candidatus Limnocylindrales bacterium]
MDDCDALIVGGGPSGSSCAWALARAGVNVAVLDRQTFPRDKVCGGWITPQVIDSLELDLSDYSRSRTLQPITGFLTGAISGRVNESRYPQPVSYGIRRVEFDDYLLRRSRARLFEGEPLSSLERVGQFWLVNRHIRARVLVGAGGHFCPVARHINPALHDDVVVAAQETEFEMTPREQQSCAVRGEIPELYFCRDLRGYGWCFRKGNFLNIGLGRLDPHHLGAHVADFVRFLHSARRISFDLRSKLLGHAYLLYGRTNRKILADGVLLIGDSAGLAYAQSGEGIRPAIESGLLAAQTIVDANSRYSRENLEPYRRRLADRFGNQEEWSTRVGRNLPPAVMSSLGRLLLATPWFARTVVVENWFLHTSDPALKPEPEAVAVS